MWNHHVADQCVESQLYWGRTRQQYVAVPDKPEMAQVVSVTTVVSTFTGLEKLEFVATCNLYEAGVPAAFQVNVGVLETVAQLPGETSWGACVLK